MKSKNGDRFFYTHTGQHGSFTKSARTILKKRTLAGIICDNTDISAIPTNVFLMTHTINFINCTDTPRLADILGLLAIGTN